MTNVINANPQTGPWIGRAARRKEDARLITGETRWTDNVDLESSSVRRSARTP
jgi:carbon-monoxide dehydrogenase large subunit